MFNQPYIPGMSLLTGKINPTLTGELKWQHQTVNTQVIVWIIQLNSIAWKDPTLNHSVLWSRSRKNVERKKEFINCNCNILHLNALNYSWRHITVYFNFPNEHYGVLDIALLYTVEWIKLKFRFKLTNSMHVLSWFIRGFLSFPIHIPEVVPQ